MIANQRLIEASDLELLRRYADLRDAEALRLLIHRHYPMVLATCRRHLRCNADAEDIAQGVFLNLMAHAGTVRANVGAWLNRCARNTATSLVRSRRSLGRREFERARRMGAAASEDEALRLEYLAAMDACLQQLPPAERQMLMQNCVAGITQQEIASAMGLSQQAVAKRIGKTLRMLRRALTSRIGVTGMVLALMATLRHAALAGTQLARASRPVPGLPMAGAVSRGQVGVLVAAAIAVAGIFYECAVPPAAVPPRNPITIQARNNSQCPTIDPAAPAPIAPPVDNTVTASSMTHSLPSGASLMMEDAASRPLSPEPVAFAPADENSVGGTEAHPAAAPASDTSPLLVAAHPPAEADGAPLHTLDPVTTTGDSILVGNAPHISPVFKSILQDSASVVSGLGEAIPSLKSWGGISSPATGDLDSWNLQLARSSPITSGTLLLRDPNPHWNYSNPYSNGGAAAPDFAIRGTLDSGDIAGGWARLQTAGFHDNMDQIETGIHGPTYSARGPANMPGYSKWGAGSPFNIDMPLSDIGDEGAQQLQIQVNGLDQTTWPSSLNITNSHTIVIVNGTIQGASSQVFTNTTSPTRDLSIAVPEPLSLSVLGLGALALLRRRDRRNPRLLHISRDKCCN